MKPAGDDTQVRPPQASNWNIANALTLLRIALVPVFAYFLLYDDGQLTTYRLLAAGVFVVATATDRIDGDIARARGLVTDFGKVSDPIADKLLMGTALVGLSMLDLLPWWVTVLVLFRELGVTALRFVVIRHGVMPASRGGKLKTALQAVAILLYILPLGSALHWLAALVMTLAVIVTVLTGIDYVRRAHTLRNTSPRAKLLRERRAAAALEKDACETPRAPATAATDAAARNEAGPDEAGRDEAGPDETGPDEAGREEAGRVAPAPEAAAPDAPAGRGAGPEV